MHTIEFIYPPVAQDEDEEEDFFYKILEEACKQMNEIEKKKDCKSCTSCSVSKTCNYCKYYSLANGFCKKHTLPKESKESCKDWVEYK